MAAFVKSPGNGVMPGEAFNMVNYGNYKNAATTLTVEVGDLIVVTNNISGSWSANITSQVSNATLIKDFVARSSSIGTAVGVWKATGTSVTISFISGRYGYGIYRNKIYSNITYKTGGTNISSSSTATNISSSVSKGDIFIGSYGLSGTSQHIWEMYLTGISSKGSFLIRNTGADPAGATILGTIIDSTVTYKIPAGAGGYAIFSVN